MPSDVDADGAYRIVLRIVTPLGLSVLALAEIVAGRRPAEEWVFMAIFLLGLFTAVHYSIDELDRRLNSDSRGVPSVDEL